MKGARRPFLLLLLGLTWLVGPVPAVARPADDQPQAGSPNRALLDLPDLYQMADLSEVTVLATVKDIARFAVFEVNEVYGGTFRRSEFRLMYRSESWERRLDGIGGIRFQRGDRYLLFLRYHREHGKVAAPNLLSLTDGSWGRIRLDSEGGPVYIEAMRLLMGAATRPELTQRHAVMVGLLASPNHLAAAAAMSQAYQRRLGSVETIPVLLAQMDRGIVGLQWGALRILRRLGPTLPPNLDRGSLAQAIHRRVSWDDTHPIPLRQEAVDALAALGPEALPTLKEIARSDSNQTIRYQAAVAVTRWNG